MVMYIICTRKKLELWLMYILISFPKSHWRIKYWQGYRVCSTYWLSHECFTSIFRQIIIKKVFSKRMWLRTGVLLKIQAKNLDFCSKKTFFSLYPQLFYSLVTRTNRCQYHWNEPTWRMKFPFSSGWKRNHVKVMLLGTICNEDF